MAHQNISYHHQQKLIGVFVDYEKAKIEYDGFEGDIIGSYITREGKEGVVVQQHGTKVVHVYGKNRLEKKE